MNTYKYKKISVNDIRLTVILKVPHIQCTRVCIYSVPKILQKLTGVNAFMALVFRDSMLLLSMQKTASSIKTRNDLYTVRHEAEAHTNTTQGNDELTCHQNLYTTTSEAVHRSAM